MPVAALRVGSQAQSHRFRLALPNVWVEAVEYGRRRPAGGVARDLLREVRPPVEVRAHAEVGARPHVGRVLVLRRRVVRPKDRVVSVDPSAGAAAEEAARAADDGTAREAATAIEPPAGEPRCGRLGDAQQGLLRTHERTQRPEQRPGPRVPSFSSSGICWRRSTTSTSTSATYSQGPSMSHSSPARRPKHLSSLRPRPPRRPRLRLRCRLCRHYRSDRHPRSYRRPTPRRPPRRSRAAGSCPTRGSTPDERR